MASISCTLAIGADLEDVRRRQIETGLNGMRFWSYIVTVPSSAFTG